MAAAGDIIPPYLRDPEAITRESFRQIEALADMSGLPPCLHPAARRLIHSNGRVEILEHLRFSPHWQDDSWATDLRAVTRIFTDSEMTRAGIIKKFLPRSTQVICTLNDAETAQAAKRLGTTRSAAAVDAWQAESDTSIAVIGNAPTALFRLLERILAGELQPRLIVACPVGFVGATESKACLTAHGKEFSCGWVGLDGREGGSAAAAAIINGLFAGEESG